MSISALNYIREQVRQKYAQDDKFYKRMLYYFELKLHSKVDIGQAGLSYAFMFPLILPPESITTDEPFAAELTPTLRGGLYVEENGIIQRTIHIRGNTGFKPKKGLPYSVPPSVSPQNVSHSRKLPTIPMADLSGQRHFQYLQDSLFRLYADLKRDPSTAKDTVMYFHNPKDDEHWTVIPRRFTLERDKSKPTMYNYNIELTIVGPADAGTDQDFDDKSILDGFNNVIHMVSLGLNLASGAINDLTAMAGDIKTQLSNINVLIGNFTTIMTAAQDFVNGVKSVIAVPHSFVTSTLELIDSMNSLTTKDSDQTATAYNTTVEYRDQTVPAWVTNKLNTVADGLEMIGAAPSAFETPDSVTMDGIRKRQEIRQSVTQVKQNEVAGSSSPSSYSELAELGTGLTPGDITSSYGSVLAGGELYRYRNLQIATVGQGDTLASLAARYLGDVRLWQYIATANGLKPPYVDDMASAPLVSSNADGPLFRNAMGIGSKILIPSNAALPSDYPLLPVIGTGVNESAENKLLGVDAFLEAQGNPVDDGQTLYDIAIDKEGGSVDVKLAEGVSNLVQAVRLRIIIEYGTDIMYKNVGLKRIIGLNFNVADEANARYRIRETVGSDPRIASLRELDFTQNNDALEANIIAEVRGLAESKEIKAVIY